MPGGIRNPVVEVGGWCMGWEENSLRFHAMIKATGQATLGNETVGAGRVWPGMTGIVGEKCKILNLAKEMAFPPLPFPSSGSM